MVEILRMQFTVGYQLLHGNVTINSILVMVTVQPEDSTGRWWLINLSSWNRLLVGVKANFDLWHMMANS